MNELRKIALKNGSDTLILPVTPESFTVNHGIDIQTVNITALGDVRIAGYPTLDSISISSFFPAQAYSWAAASYSDPWGLIEKIQSWMTNKTVLRFIVTGTYINKPVLVEGIDIGESGGSNDITYALTLAEYRFVSTGAATAAGAMRAIETQPAAAEYYTAEPGDSLRSIAQKYHGDPNKCNKLADLNGIGNAAILKAGTQVRLSGGGVSQTHRNRVNYVAEY